MERSEFYRWFADPASRALYREPELSTHSRTKRFDHPVLGELELYCEVIDNRDQQQTLVVFTATPGSESAEKLQLLSVLGSQTLDPAR